MNRRNGIFSALFCCATLVACATESSVSAPSFADTGTFSKIPLTAAEERDIRGQIERNWNLGELAGSPDLTGMVVEVRIALQPDGTVTSTRVINSGSGPAFRQVSESAIRAVMISSPLTLPPGKSYESMVLRFHPDQVMQ